MPRRWAGRSHHEQPGYRSHFTLVGILVAGSSAFAQSTGTSVAPVYAPVKEIPIGGAGGWDYLSVDPDAHRLYVSHGTKIVVVDTEQNTVVGEITDTPGVHGFAIASDLGRGFSSNGREDKVSIVDLKTLQTIQKVGTAGNPDAITYEPTTHEVYAMNGRGQSATVIDANHGAGSEDAPHLPRGGEFRSSGASRSERRAWPAAGDPGDVPSAGVRAWRVAAVRRPTAHHEDHEDTKITKKISVS
jgi:DNA-binding beta-propeller fold protein YncE